MPYVVTKKTVFKWQEGFWTIMQDVFNEHYRERFREAGILDRCGGELQHLISDAATMQIIRWTNGAWSDDDGSYDAKRMMVLMMGMRKRRTRRCIGGNRGT